MNQFQKNYSIITLEEKIKNEMKYFKEKRKILTLVNKEVYCWAMFRPLLSPLIVGPKALSSRSLCNGDGPRRDLWGQGRQRMRLVESFFVKLFHPSPSLRLFLRVIEVGLSVDARRIYYMFLMRNLLNSTVGFFNIQNKYLIFIFIIHFQLCPFRL